MLRRRNKQIAVGLAVFVAVIVACAPTVDDLKKTTYLSTATNTPAQSWTPAPNTTRDYRGVTVAETRSGGAGGSSLNLLTVSGSGTGICGLVGGTWVDPHPSTLWDDEHYRSGVKAERPRCVFTQLHIVDEGDGFKPKADDVRLAFSWIQRSGDDCWQSDYGNGGLALQDSLLEDCFSGVSARPSSSIDASQKEPLVISGTLLSVSDKLSCYKPDKYGCPQHAGWLKWADTGGLRVDLIGDTFAATTYPEIGNLALNAPTHSCNGVTLDWLGVPGPDQAKFISDAATWQQACPDVSIKTGSAAQQDWSSKVSAWHSAHSVG